MKRTNAIVLLIVSIIIMIVGGGLYWAQRTGRLAILGAFEGWPDVTPDNPAYEEIMYNGDNSWMVGYPSDGLFHPAQDATRAEITVGIIRAREEPISGVSCNMGDPSTWPFTDVACDYWAFTEIAIAKNLGLVQGYPDGSYLPDQPITRAEMVIFIVKAKEWSLSQAPACIQGDPSTYPFPDVDCNNPAVDYIAIAKAHRIVFGYPGGNFEPDWIATRADLAVILYRGFVQAGQELSIKGLVTNANTSAAIPGATVSMVQAIEGTQLTSTTDSTGAYLLRVVATSGAYTVRASASGYQSQTQGVTLDTDKTVNFSLFPVSGTEGVITGRVTKAEDNQALAGATVNVLNYENGSQLADITDSTGAYQLRVGSTTGTYSVRASATGYDSKTLSATLSGGTASLNFSLSRTTNEPTEPGGTPILIDTTGGNVATTATGAVLPVTLVLLGTILSLFSLVYLLKTNKP